MVIDYAKYITFLVTTLIICIVPGPDMMYILANSIKGGAKSGIISAAGMACGMLAYTMLASTGLAASFFVSKKLFDFIQIIGGIYLLWIAYQTFIDISAIEKVEVESSISLIIVFKRALVTNLLNPKIALFYVAFLPQFTNPELGNVTFQLLLLGFSFLIMGFIVDSIIGVLSGKLSSMIASKGVIKKYLNKVSAVIYVALAIRLFFVF